jgi:hypothetical protein
VVHDYQWLRENSSLVQTLRRHKQQFILETTCHTTHHYNLEDNNPSSRSSESSKHFTEVPYDTKFENKMKKSNATYNKHIQLDGFVEQPKV